MRSLRHNNNFSIHPPSICSSEIKPVNSHFMQEVKLNYHNGALRSKCFELCRELYWWTKRQGILGVPLFYGGNLYIFAWRWRSWLLCRVQPASQQCLQAKLVQHECNSIQCLPGHRGNQGGNRRVLPEELSVLLSEHVLNQVVVIT